MTKQEAVSKLVAWLMSQVGYHESPNNNTVYAETDIDTKLYGFDMHAAPWCDFFADYAYIHCFGYELGTRMTYQSPSGSALCKTSAGFYQQNGAWTQTPEVGDQIFFYVGGDINHTGIVIEVSTFTIDTVEGNSGDAVRRNTYYLTDNSIAGYGRPKWSLLSNDIEDAVEDPPEQNITVITKMMQGPTPLLTKAYADNYLKATEALQCLLQLREAGSGVEITGYYDDSTADAVKEAQARYGLQEDSECGRDTWYALIMDN